MTKSFEAQLAEAMRKDASGSLPVVDPEGLARISIDVYSAPQAKVRALAAKAKAEGKTPVTLRIRLPRVAEPALALLCITPDGMRIHVVVE